MPDSVLSPEEREEIREVFDLFDADGSGRIDLKELKEAVEALGFKSKNQTIYQLIGEIGTEPLDFNGFVNLIEKRLVTIFSLSFHFFLCPVSDL